MKFLLGTLLLVVALLQLLHELDILGPDFGGLGLLFISMVAAIGLALMFSWGDEL